MRRADVKVRRCLRNVHLSWSTLALRASAWLSCRENQDRAIYLCAVATVGVLLVWSPT